MNIYNKFNSNNSKDTSLIEKYLKAIDKGKIDKIKDLLNKNKNIKQDIVLEIYNKNLLTYKRLNFIIKNCSNDLNISYSLIKSIIKDDNIVLLDLLFDNFKFYDNKFILDILLIYKYKTPISCSDLKEKISKYKILKGSNSNHNDYSCYGNKVGIYFYDAFQKINAPLSKYIIEYGVIINKKDEQNLSSLHYACKYGHNKIVKYLIEHGANINEKHDSGYTPLHLACFNGHENSVKYLIEQGADIYTRDKDGNTSLHLACKQGYVNVAKCLIEYGANINKMNFDGCTPLHLACENKQKNMAYYLIEQGADINKLNFERCTPLYLAYHHPYGDKDIIKYVIEHGIDIDNIKINKYSLLIFAYNNDDEELIKYLIEHGADINKEDLS
eukprot:jgi/Orpsp1_1/1181834/evm.model.c7180000078802.1